MFKSCAIIIATAFVSSPAPIDQVWAIPPVVSEWSVVERLVFAVPLSDFLAEARNSTHDARLDWTSDGCSAPVIGGTGRSFDFTDSCRRHDFAYRNIRRIDHGILWTPPMRHRVDSAFLRDMRHQCAQRRVRDRPTCVLWAIVFYRSVRLYAGP